MTAGTAAAAKRIASIDALRGLVMLLVLVDHVPSRPAGSRASSGAAGISPGFVTSDGLPALPAYRRRRMIGFPQK